MTFLFFLSLVVNLRPGEGFFRFILTRTLICTFDLWPPRCWLPAAAASPKPLYACWQPGSKGCKTLVASLNIVNADISLPYSYTPPSQEEEEKNSLQLHLIIYVKIKKHFFYFSEDDKTISNYFFGSDHIDLFCEKDLQHVEHSQNTIQNLMKAIILIIIKEFMG